ncbi:MAG: helix-turn-helix domain-containing protein [Pseudomonadota bacterium]
MKTARNENTDPSSSLGRAIDVLGLFSLETPFLSVEEVGERLGYTRSTAYRYLKALGDGGLVASMSNGTYGLGPRIIELDRLLALTDPLYRAGKKVLGEYFSDHSALLLHSLYGDQVLCIHKEGPDQIVHKGKKITVGRARGVPLPLFQGAASLALLPFLSPHKIKETYLRHSGNIALAGLGGDWDEFRKNMTSIRRTGYATTHDQIVSNMTGIAVPILLPEDRRLVGSLSKTFPTGSTHYKSVEAVVLELRDMSEKISVEYLRASRRQSAAN